MLTLVRLPAKRPCNETLACALPWAADASNGPRRSRTQSSVRVGAGRPVRCRTHAGERPRRTGAGAGAGAGAELGPTRAVYTAVPMANAKSVLCIVSRGAKEAGRHLTCIRRAVGIHNLAGRFVRARPRPSAWGGTPPRSRSRWTPPRPLLPSYHGRPRKQPAINRREHTSLGRRDNAIVTREPSAG